MRKILKEYKILFRSIPSLFVAVFMLSVLSMNLLAGKELFNTRYLALDCGFTLSWISFLCMDIVCKRFGARAGLRLSVLALAFNLVFCGIFYLVTLTGGHWSEYYSFVDEGVQVAAIADTAVNEAVGGNWYIVLGSALAMFLGSSVNSLVNGLVGRMMGRDNFKAFALRSYTSTILGQFTDNLVFATVVSHVLFGWTWTQVLTCSATAAVFELLCEVLFSPLGYKMSRLWAREGVGDDYLAFTGRN